MNKFLIKTLGCKVNQYDSAHLKTLLLNYGWSYSTFKPDYIILNTCAVTTKAIKKDRQAWQSLEKKYPQAKIIIMGCWPEVYKEKIFKSAYLVTGTANILKLAKKLNNKVDSSLDSLIKKTDRSRYFLKVGDGCFQFCSYCIIPYARGPLKSRLLTELVEEAREAEKNNYREIVLTGIHLGAYGKDLDNKLNTNLFKLLKKLLKETEKVRFRLSSIEINELNNNLINLIVNNQNRICHHLHIPLQSGSSKILKLMKRPYTADYYYKKVEEIKNKIPDLAISTDIIVGFPQETDKDFEDSCKLVEKITFSKIHVFSFSAHLKTKAAKYKNQIADSIKKKRSSILRKLSDELANYYQAKILSAYQEFYLIIERKDKDIFTGRSQYYFSLKFKFKNKKKDKIKIGDLLLVKKSEIIII